MIAMTVDVEVFQFQSEPYDTRAFHVLAQNAIIASQRIKGKDVNITLSVACVDNEEIRRINAAFRHKDAETDVISIGEYSDERDIQTVQDGDIFLGEVILCYNYIAQYANEEGYDPELELYTVFTHGVLHLLGYKHGQEMFEMQERISKEYVLKNATV